MVGLIVVLILKMLPVQSGLGQFEEYFRTCVRWDDMSSVSVIASARRFARKSFRTSSGSGLVLKVGRKNPHVALVMCQSSVRSISTIVERKSWLRV